MSERSFLPPRVHPTPPDPQTVIAYAWSRVVDAVCSHPDWDEEEGDGPHDIADFVERLLAQDAAGMR